jgi:hypothetical protein
VSIAPSRVGSSIAAGLRLARPLAQTLGLTLALTTACMTRTLAQDPHALAVSPSDGVTLRAGRTDVPLTVVQATREIGARRSLAERVGALPPGQTMLLTLQQLAAAAAPGVTYNVYLNLPATRAPQGAADPHYLGTVSFFDAPSGRARDVVLDITAPLARLTAAGLLTADPIVTIVAAGEPGPDAAPRLARILITTK